MASLIERPVIRRWCPECWKITESWFERGSEEHCRECDPPPELPKAAPRWPWER